MTTSLVRLAWIVAAISSLSCAAPPSTMHTDGGVCTDGGCLPLGMCRPGDPPARFRSQLAPPGNLMPGDRATVSVTFDNCSGHTWTQSGYALRPQAPAMDTTWGVARIPLPTDVPNGAEITIPFQIVSPTQSGTYPFQWSITQEGVAPLQQPSDLLNVDVRSNIDCTQPGPLSRLVTEVSPPAFVAVGASVHASVTFKNCSTDTWSRAAGFQLGSQADQDNMIWGTSRIPLPEDVPPGGQVTIPIQVTAPSAPGSYRFAWEIVHEGIRWYSEASPTEHVTVLEPIDCSHTGPAARFVTETAPAATLTPNQAFHASVTFGNCSGTTWDTTYHIAAAVPASDTTWSTGRIALPFPVGSGFALDVAFDGHAPTTPGSFAYRWSINHDGVGALDEPSPAHTITVGCSCGDHNCGDDGCGGSCGTCASGAMCDGAHCQTTCGLNGHPCCPGRACSDGSLCTDTGFGPLCLCGTNGRACCPGRSCTDGSLCTDTGFGPLCLCGSNGQVCCPGRSCTDGSLCTDTGFGPLCLCGTNGRACCTGRSCTDGTLCTDTGFGPLCLPADMPSCGATQWWNTYITYAHVVSGWNDTDLGVPSSTPVQLRHRSLLTGTGVYGWGYMPEFTDLVTGDQFRLLHLRPQNQNATNVGTEYPAGFIVGLSGGDTVDTGLGPYSTGAHLCVQTLVAYRDAFPEGMDACR